MRKSATFWPKYGTSYQGGWRKNAKVSRRRNLTKMCASLNGEVVGGSALQGAFKVPNLARVQALAGALSQNLFAKRAPSDVAHFPESSARAAQRLWRRLSSPSAAGSSPARRAFGGCGRKGAIFLFIGPVGDARAFGAVGKAPDSEAKVPRSSPPGGVLEQDLRTKKKTARRGAARFQFLRPP